MPDVEYLDYGVVEERGWHVDEEALFEKAAAADLDGAEYGRMEVSGEECILDAAEREGLDWSVKCRKGRCGRCAAIVVDGDVDMDAEQEFLTREEIEAEDLRLPCVSEAETDLKLVYGARTLDRLEDRVK